MIRRLAAGRDLVAGLRPAIRMTAAVRALDQPSGPVLAAQLRQLAADLHARLPT